MEKIVYLLSDISLLEQKNVNAYLIPVKGMSTRSMSEYALDEIKKIKSITNKEIYLLCDTLIMENDLHKIKDCFKELSNLGDKIFFSDFSFYMEAKKYGCLDKMVFYSPTLSVSSEDILTWNELGINDVIISKECELNGYKKILTDAKNMNLGMLALGYPQIYFSKRKMLSSFLKQYPDVSFVEKNHIQIQEKSRPMLQNVYEDDRGTYIFAGEVFFAENYLFDLAELGMKYFIIDPTFIAEKEILSTLVYNAINKINNENKLKETTSTFMMFREMINNYEK